MRKVFEEYKVVSSVDITETIKSETSDLFQEALLAIGQLAIALELEWFPRNGKERNEWRK